MVRIDQELVKSLADVYDKAADVAKSYAEAKGIEYTENLRKSVSKHFLKLNKDLSQETETIQYDKSEFILKALKDDGTVMTIKEFCEAYGIPFEDVKSYKFITHLKYPTFNIASKTSDVESTLDLSDMVKSFEGVVANIENVKSPSPEKVALNSSVLKIIFTDLHVGAEVSHPTKGLYKASWGREDLFKTLDIMVSEIRKVSLNNSIHKILIEDLGDTVDGFNSLTTRGGHQLPQNMSNEEMFDNAVSFKSLLVTHINSVFKYKIPIELHSICNDNHGGSFTYVVNSAVKTYLEAKFTNVQCFNHTKFISHYFCGRHVFILSHGKDADHLKFGFTVPVNQKGIDKIQEYMKINNLYSRGYFVSFNKGDTHVQQLDDSCSDDFSYNSYMALSPSTQWVQHNFKRGKRGFNIQMFKEETRGISNTPHYIEYVD